MWRPVLDVRSSTKGMPYLLINPMLRNDLSHNLTFVYFCDIILYIL